MFSLKAYWVYTNRYPSKLLKKHYHENCIHIFYRRRNIKLEPEFFFIFFYRVQDCYKTTNIAQNKAYEILPPAAVTSPKLLLEHIKVSITKQSYTSIPS